MDSRKQQIVNYIKEDVAKHLDLSAIKLFIFGSQANLPKLKAADIDIGILSNKPINKNVFFFIHNTLNNDERTLYSFDLVDFNKVSEDFKKIALSNIELIN